MTRLNKSQKEQITKDVLKHRFSDAADTLIDERAAFALEVYNDIYTGAERKKMKALPKGWLPVCSRVGVKFGSGYGSFEHLPFDGTIYGVVNGVKSKDRKRHPGMPMASVHDRTCAKTYETGHPLAVKYEAIKDKISDLSTAIVGAKRQIEAALNSASSAKRLIEMWPEVEPFVAPYFDQPKNLPALPTDQLNKLLDLPVSEAA